MKLWKILAINILVNPIYSFIAPKSNVQHRRSTHLFEQLNQSKDALRILVDYQEGTWKGIATSFSVSNDVSAGVRMRKVSPEYKSTIKIGLDLQKQDYTMSETFEWEDKMKRRDFSLVEASVDVDTVDGSYSVDNTFPNLPSDLIGTESLLQFGVEHCVAVSDDDRVRVFALYGVDQSLSRIVVCQETRNAEPVREDILKASPKQEPKEGPEFIKENESLTPMPINLMELTSGVWLGNMIVREPASYEEPKGFGSRPISREKQFGKWSMGVQRIAFEWNWDFEESIQKVITVGKALGLGLPVEMSTPISGIVCQDESMRTSIPKEERLSYVDWMGGDQVGIFINNIGMQLPRYFSFEKVGGKSRRTFFTEVSVYQAEGSGALDSVRSKPDMICSVIARAYSTDGQLKQASTGFFELDRSMND